MGSERTWFWTTEFYSVTNSVRPLELCGQSRLHWPPQETPGLQILQEVMIMEVKVGDRTYHLENVCPTDGPKLATLRRHLRAHGPEALISSSKYGPYAACVLSDLTEVGVKVVRT